MTGDGNRLRIVSYNVHACIGRDGKFRPQRIADVLRSLDADVIGLQEVEDRAFGGGRVSDFLADELGMQAWRGPTLQRDDADYGNLLLSRLEPDEVREVSFDEGKREPRGAIEATLRHDEVALNVVATHLCLSARERVRQLKRILARLKDRSAEVAVLLGDINEWRPFSAVDRQLRAHFGDQRLPRSFPAARPVLRLDRILVAPRSIVRGSGAIRTSLTAAASDHLPVYTDLSLNRLHR